MNPLKYGQFLKWLTRDKSLEKLYKEGKLFPASEAPIPTKKPGVEAMEAINRFVKDNPRIDQPKEGVIQSAFDTATREAQMGNYPAPKYETFRARYLRNLNKKEDGGSIGGGNIKGVQIGDRTGFANIFLDQGKPSRFSPNSDTVVLNGKEYLKITKKGDPNFGKYVYRTSVKAPGYGRSGKSKNEYLTYKQLEKRVNAPKTGKQKFTSYSKGYLAELEDIKKFVNNKGAKNIFLSDLVEMFGDLTKETSDDAIRDKKTETKIKRAIGDAEYKKLIKGGERSKIIAQKKKDANALVRAVKRGEKPLIALSSEMTGEVPNVFKSYLGKVELGMYKSMSPKLKAILSRVTQPRQIYEGTNAIEELRNTTIKTYNKIIKKYPEAQAARNVLTSGKGIVAYNDRSYILSQLFRHVQNGGTKYSYVSGDTTATIKFRNNETGKLITLNNINVNDPDFKEAADTYNQKEKILKTEIDDPRKKGAKVKIGQAIAANGDSIVIDHLSDVKNEPLKNLVITNQKANMAATIKGATEAELASIGRGLKLSLEDNTKRFSNYAKRLLISPDKKRPGPKETIFKKEGTLRGVTDPPDLEIKKIISSLSSKPICQITFGGTKSPALKADGGRIGYANGPASINDCFDDGLKNFKNGNYKTADQVQNAAKLLRGGRAVISGLMKYGIVPELAYVGLEAAGRTLLGEKPTNALLKSIDTLTFGATDFTSGIEAEKFGKFSDQKLAVDKFRNSQSLVTSLQNKLANLKNITDQDSENYVGDLTSDIQATEAQLRAAQQELQKNTVSPDLVRFIDKKGQDIADTQMAKSDFAKRSLKDQMEGIPGIRDYTDTESTRIFPSQPNQIDLNLNMFPELPRDFMQLNTSEAINLAQKLRREGQEVSAKDVLDYRDSLKQMPLSEQAEIYGDEQIYGTQGADVLQPLAGGGIAKLAGVSSGIAPLKGPQPQGLSYLMKRGIKT